MAGEEQRSGRGIHISRRDFVFRVLPVLAFGALDVACGGLPAGAQADATAIPTVPAEVASATPTVQLSPEPQEDPWVNFDVAPLERDLRGLEWRGDVTAVLGEATIRPPETGGSWSALFAQTVGAEFTNIAAFQVQTSDSRTHQFPIIEVTGDDDEANNGLWWVTRNMDSRQIEFKHLFFDVNTTANYMRLGYSFGPEDQYLATVLAGRYDPATRRWVGGESLAFYPVMPEGYYRIAMGGGQPEASPTQTPAPASTPSTDTSPDVQQIVVTPAAVQLVSFHPDTFEAPQPAEVGPDLSGAWGIPSNATEAGSRPVFELSQLAAILAAEKEHFESATSATIIYQPAFGSGYLRGLALGEGSTPVSTYWLRTSRGDVLIAGLGFLDPAGQERIHHVAMAFRPAAGQADMRDEAFITTARWIEKLHIETQPFIFATEVLGRGQNEPDLEFVRYLFSIQPDLGTLGTQMENGTYPADAELRLWPGIN